MRPRQNLQSAVLGSGRVEVEPQGEYPGQLVPLQRLTIRLANVEVLMPPDLPIRCWSLIEEQASYNARLFLKEMGEAKGGFRSRAYRLRVVESVSSAGTVTPCQQAVGLSLEL